MIRKKDDFEQQLAQMRAFVDSELQPLEADFLRNSHALETTLNAKRAKVRELGLWAPNLPKSLGGMGIDLVQLGRVSEVLGRSPLGHYSFGCQAPDAGNAELLHLYGNDEQKTKYLTPLAAGDIRSCFGMTEPNTAGSNPTLLQTRAEKIDGGWRIKGHKWFTSSADGAAFSIVMAVTDPEAEPHQRASMFLVDTANPGWGFVRNIPVMGEAHGGYFAHSEIDLNDVEIGDDALLGEVGAGFAMAQARLGPGRIHHCMRWLGICARALDLMCQRASSRQIAADTVLGDTQFAAGWIAESAAEIAAARALVLETAAAVQEHGFKSARTQVSMIKYHVAGVLQRVLDRALQAHGALGMTDDTVIAWYYRHERAARIYDGPDEVHQLSVARQLLKPYRKSS